LDPLTLISYPVPVFSVGQIYGRGWELS